jgi:hypothetical protein
MFFLFALNFDRNPTWHIYMFMYIYLPGFVLHVLETTDTVNIRGWMN